MITSRNIYLRELEIADCNSFLKMVSRSKSFYTPWITPPSSEQTFFELIEKNKKDGFQSFPIFKIDSNEIVGIFNLSQIVRGLFLSAYLSYYVDFKFSNQGYMKEGLELLLKHVFNEFGLHRLEANIQPKNKASIALVKACGFIKEGYSEKYLKINGIWSDHERWAIIKEYI